MDLQTWLLVAPVLQSEPESDVHSLTTYVRSAEAMLGLLPTKPERSQEQAADAERVHRACRVLRSRFLSIHAEWLYSLLRQGAKEYQDLSELAFEAALLCPGLLPTRSQMVSERARPQCDKEGYEIDQALFFHHLLRSTKIGTHLLRAALLPTKRAKELCDSFRNTGRLDLGSVLIERIGCAAHLTLNNRDSLNAEDDGLVHDLETAVDLALLDEKVKVGVLRGGVMAHPRYLGRRVFSAGINLKALRAGKISFVDFILRRELGFIQKIIRGLASSSDGWEAGDSIQLTSNVEKPWLAVVDGFAIGGGAQLLLVFDRVIADRESYFSLPAATEGLIPGFANLRLARFMGPRKARQAILFGRKIFAQDPDADLLFDSIVQSSELENVIEREVQELSRPGMIANRHMLNLLEEPISAFLHYAAEFALRQADRLYSKDLLQSVSPMI